MSIEKLRANIEYHENSLTAAIKATPFSYGGDECLRNSICGFATIILHDVIRDTYGVSTKREIVTSDQLFAHTRRGHMSEHVMLRSPENTIIDPTYSQFMNVIGLDLKLVERVPALAALYPERKIAIIPSDSTDEFCHNLSQMAYSARDEVNSARQEVYPGATKESHQKFMDLSPEDIALIYQSIWVSTQAPKPFPISDDDRNSLYYRKVMRVLSEQTPAIVGSDT